MKSLKLQVRGKLQVVDQHRIIPRIARRNLEAQAVVAQLEPIFSVSVFVVASNDEMYRVLSAPPLYSFMKIKVIPPATVSLGSGRSGRSGTIAVAEHRETWREAVLDGCSGGTGS
ncbi:hypothetical protein [Amycolatopsis camponoti]|uniref:hypothetical protein n=1 Tax=Amycolatopsis camponoti TaxID=2606593 RepID=UPI0018C2CAAD|nr:hypothetical protein [Amycolatopsis camponoti]